MNIYGERNYCEDCSKRDTCNLCDNVNFCEDCKDKYKCDIRTVCCDCNHDIECNNGFESMYD